MPDPVLWPFAPDWSEPVLERLQWRTAVLASDSGAEQRAATRIAPRRSVEARFLLAGPDRAYGELLLQRKGSARFRVPLWFHRSRLNAAVTAGATVLPCSTADREFRAGDHVFLRGDGPFTCETVEIAAVAADSLTLATGCTFDHPVGTVLHPARLAWLDAEDVDHPTNRVGEFSARFEIDAGQDEPADTHGMTLVDGVPLFDRQNNWIDGIRRTRDWLREDFDADTGATLRVDTADRAFDGSRLSIMLHGRADQAAFRRMLSWLDGQRRGFWLSSRADDIEIAADAAAGATVVDIVRAGLAEAGGIAPDVSRLLLSGETALALDALGTAPDSATERVNLAAPLPRAITAGERGSWLRRNRLAQDTVTLRHVTDSGGIATAEITTRSFADTRDGSAPGDHPIDNASMTAGGCGCGPEVTVTAYTFQFSAPPPGTEQNIYGTANISTNYFDIQNPDFWFDVDPYIATQVFPGFDSSYEAMGGGGPGVLIGIDEWVTVDYDIGVPVFRMRWTTATNTFEFECYGDATNEGRPYHYIDYFGVDSSYSNPEPVTCTRSINGGPAVTLPLVQSVEYRGINNAAQPGRPDRAHFRAWFDHLAPGGYLSPNDL